MLSMMKKDLEDWLSKNFCPLIETTGSLICELKYCANNTKGKIAIVFSRYHNDKDPWEYIIDNCGYVLTVPSFWLSIPRELVIPYLEFYIDGYMDEYVYNKKQNNNNSHQVPHVCPPHLHHPYEVNTVLLSDQACSIHSNPNSQITCTNHSDNTNLSDT